LFGRSYEFTAADLNGPDLMPNQIIYKYEPYK